MKQANAARRETCSPSLSASSAAATRKRAAVSAG